MKGYHLNPDENVVNRVIEGIRRKDGHCPCRIKVDDTTLCPCDDFIQNENCICKLYIKKEEE